MLQETKSFISNGESPRLNPFFIPKIISDIPAGHISIKYGLKGPNYSAVSACASASNAIINAFNYIKLGFSDAFVTGGSEACVNELGIGGFNAMMALSTRNDDPKKTIFFITLPFDGGKASFGNGTMVAFKVLSQQIVDKVHELAIKNGGINEGDPGIREGYDNMYFSYFRDLDNNKICVYS